MNILPDQKEKFPEVAGIDPEFFPVVRARLESVAGEAIDAERERKRRGNNLSRSFNPTYRETLLDDEKIIRGEGLFGPGYSKEEPPPVSVLDQVAEISDMKIGDAISFDIQGVPLTAKISSIRTRTREALGPYFYFVFPESVLKSAPHTFFTAARVGEERVAPGAMKMVPQTCRSFRRFLFRQNASASAGIVGWVGWNPCISRRLGIT